MPSNASTQKARITNAWAVASPRGLSNGLRMTLREDKPLPWLSVSGWNFEEKKNVTVGFAVDKMFLRNLKAVAEEALEALD